MYFCYVVCIQAHKYISLVTSWEYSAQNCRPPELYLANLGSFWSKNWRAAYPGASAKHLMVLAVLFLFYQIHLECGMEG